MNAFLESIPVLTLILLSPVFALLVTIFIPKEREDLVRWTSLGFSAFALLLAVLVFVGYDQGRAKFVADFLAEVGWIKDFGVTWGDIEYQFVEKVPWIKQLGISYFNAVDGINAPLLLLNAIVYFTGVWSMWELKNRVKEYYAFMHLLVLGVFGVFMAQDLFFFFLYYEIAVVPMYPLIAIWGSTRKEYAAMKLTLYLMAGSALIIPGILLLFSYTTPATFDMVLMAQTASFPFWLQKIAFILLLFGFGTLAGCWPFHTWSPVGHVAAPTAVSMLHAGVLMKLGAYGVLRVGMMLCPEGLAYWASLMAVLATVGIVYGAFVGLAQTDLKYVIGYSSVSHMGIVMLGLSTMTIDGINGAVFQMFAHGVMTALFFSAVGYIYDHAHTRMIPELGGFSQIMPTGSAFFIVACLAGIGVPVMASFWAELLVFISAFKTYPIRGTFAILGLVISALFMLRVVQKTFFGVKKEKFVGLPDMRPFLAAPRALIVGVIVFFGLFPRLMTDLIQTAVGPLVGGWH